MPQTTIDAIADELLGALEHHQSLPLITDRHAALDLAAAYQVTDAVRARRALRGETSIGRKIGFTNRTIWDEYKVYAPIWGDMYDTTVTSLLAADGLCDLGKFVEPRIEPEIVFELAATPRADMDDAEFISCVSRVAHGFEIVQSLFPDWKFKAADTVAAFGLHGRLFLGSWADVTADNTALWLEDLTNFEVDLECNSQIVDTGHAENVLDGPLQAMRHLCEVLEADPNNPQLRPGEIITTGTLTRAFVVEPGQTWQTKIRGAALDGIAIHFSEGKTPAPRT